MDEVAAPQQQYYYRSIAIEIAPGRFSRDSWALEPWIARDMLKRGTEGKFTVHRKPAKGERKHPGPPVFHKPENMPQVRGLYVLTELRGFQPGGRFSVVARCTGQSCGGKRSRTFAARDWANLRLGVRGCNKCTCAIRSQQRLEAKRAMGIA